MLITKHTIGPKISADYAVAFVAEYRQRRYKYEELKELVMAEVRHIADDTRSPIAHLEGRTKDPDRVFEKIKRKNYSDPANQLMDICGARVITAYHSDVEVLAGAIRQGLKPVAKCVEEHSEAKRPKRPDEFGYESIHLVFRIAGNHVPWKRYKHFYVEIQIRSTLRHGWAMVSHEILYKQVAQPPDHFLTSMAHAMGAIHSADSEFDAARKYCATVRRKFTQFIRNGRLGRVGLEDLSLSLYFSIRERKYEALLKKLKGIAVRCGMQQLDLPEFNPVSIGRMALTLSTRGVKTLHRAQQIIDHVCRDSGQVERMIRVFMREVQFCGGIFNADGIDIITVLVSMFKGETFAMTKFPHNFDWSGRFLSRPTSQVLKATRRACRHNLAED